LGAKNVIKNDGSLRERTLVIIVIYFKKKSSNRRFVAPINTATKKSSFIFSDTQSQRYFWVLSVLSHLFESCLCLFWHVDISEEF
jgi:hypothetical protein